MKRSIEIIRKVLGTPILVLGGIFCVVGWNIFAFGGWVYGPWKHPIRLI